MTADNAGTQPLVLVVIPTYDERDNILHLLRVLRGTVPSAHVLVVDDGSPDGTADLVEEHARREPSTHLLRRSGKSGLGSAYRAGFAWARHRGYETIVQMDADLSHDPSDPPPMLAARRSGAQLVIGSRYQSDGMIAGWPRRRRVRGTPGWRRRSRGRRGCRP